MTAADEAFDRYIENNTGVRWDFLEGDLVSLWDEPDAETLAQIEDDYYDERVGEATS